MKVLNFVPNNTHPRSGKENHPQVRNAVLATGKAAVTAFAVYKLLSPVPAHADEAAPAAPRQVAPAPAPRCTAEVTTNAERWAALRQSQDFAVDNSYHSGIRLDRPSIIDNVVISVVVPPSVVAALRSASAEAKTVLAVECYTHAVEQLERGSLVLELDRLNGLIFNNPQASPERKMQELRALKARDNGADFARFMRELTATQRGQLLRMFEGDSFTEFKTAVPIRAIEVELRDVAIGGEHLGHENSGNIILRTDLYELTVRLPDDVVNRRDLNAAKQLVKDAIADELDEQNQYSNPTRGSDDGSGDQSLQSANSFVSARESDIRTALTNAKREKLQNRGWTISYTLGDSGEAHSEGLTYRDIRGQHQGRLNHARLQARIQEEIRAVNNASISAEVLIQITTPLGPIVTEMEQTRTELERLDRPEGRRRARF